MHGWLGKVFDGYRLLNSIASGDEEGLFKAERVRDGEEVQVRLPLSEEDRASHARLRRRYEAEARASAELRATGAVLGVREIIEVDGVPGLVTELPRGRSLNERFAEVHGPWPLRQVLPWFRKLCAALESAHELGHGHGSLNGRAIYLEDQGRVTICGIATLPAAEAEHVRRADARSLAALLYRATTGKTAQAGFPYTGQPQSPAVFVEGYPTTLGRFLVARLEEGNDDDPVADAGVFRRSLEAMSVDPEFRRRAGLLGDSGKPDIVVESSDRWRRAAWAMLAAAVVAAVSVGITFTIMQSRLEHAAQRAARAPAPVAPAAAAPAGTAGGRNEAWSCLHARFSPAAGVITSEDVARCLRLAPESTADELRREATALATAFGTSPEPDDAEKSVSQSFRRLFNLGPDEVEQHLSYRLSRRLSTGGLEQWVASNRDGQVSGVLHTLSGRTGAVADWARRQLTAMP